MPESTFELRVEDIAWCPGCGNFGIRNAVIAALDELGLDKQNTVYVSGIGQAAKIPHYLDTHFFNGLHGRALPPATAIKASNPSLTVIVESGDGDIYGEGGNHFIHAIRRNPDITVIVHNNMVYGLTKGQASPTSQIGMHTPVQVFGVFENPVNPLSLALSLNAPFIARAFSGDIDRTKEIIKKAILHKGFSLVDVFQPCVSFNKLNNFQWFRAHTYYLEDSYDPGDRVAAFKRAIEEAPLPLGIFYQNEGRSTFEENLDLYRREGSALYKRKPDSGLLEKMIRRYI
jgi:2-oxoglutarate ferredoxin oxidoreductase subunit beta